LCPDAPATARYTLSLRDALPISKEVRSHSNGAFHMNLWIPDPVPVRDADREKQLRDFLKQWGPDVPADMGASEMYDFGAQCDALDRKSTRLNSSHVKISYAVFCL